MSEDIQKALTAVELREAALLSWGAVSAEWRRDEIVTVLEGFGDGEQILDEMVDLALVVETPSGHYRSRSAETVRLLATLRQAFRGEALLSGRPLVLDYRFLQRPRRRPKRNVEASRFVAEAGATLGKTGQSALQILAPGHLSAFQERSTQQVLAALGASDAAGVVVTAGTGSGKTLAFYMPMLAWICDNTQRPEGVLALALYPRNELLKDQLKALVAFALRLQNVGGSRSPISLGTWFGSTPTSARMVREGKADSWRKASDGFVCPFLECPSDGCEDGALVWPNSEIRADVEMLRCSKCGTEIPGSLLRLTRDSVRAKPPRVMLSTTESLNRQLSSPGNLAAFGVTASGLRAVLLDEVHTYEGTTGAQNAYLFRRLRKALGYDPLWAGLSATLADGAGFFGRLVDLDPGRVTVIEPDASELEESGAEYLMALRHNPHGSTGTLSTTIQTAMLLSRALDPMVGNPFEPPVDSSGIFGSRLFAFTDKLDTTNRLYWDLLDAEGWAWPGRVNQNTSPLTLAHLRSQSQNAVTPGRREDASQRDLEGQHWWLPEALGHEIDQDVQKQVGRTSSQDSGVAASAEIVVATASLEVGFDDDRVGAVLQHKAPHDVAQFLQRKGRAGRNAATRPWTVVVLSDWGRDREAWDAYDALFSPVVPPRSLPLENLYVQRIQSVYSLLDWLAERLDYGRNSTWMDSSGPADLLANDPRWRSRTEERQSRLADLLDDLLRDGPERASLIRHLRRSLGLGYGPHADVTLDKLLWEAPRPLLAVVVPTLRRRLKDQWASERPAAGDLSLRTRTPLREFVPGNLFDDLLVPDVEFEVPWVGGGTEVEHLPALRAIREFLPGNVSRHFGVWASNKRHWVELPSRLDNDGAHLVEIAIFGGIAIDDVERNGRTIRVFAPSRVELQSVDPAVSDASSMRADWVFSATPLGAGTRLPLAGSAARFFTDTTAHLHSQGGGVRVVRFAESGHGVLWSNGQSTPKQVRFISDQSDPSQGAALGVEVHVDALRCRVELPRVVEGPTPIERTEWLREMAVSGDRLPEEMTDFDRASLVDATELVAARWDWPSGDPDDRRFSDELRVAATINGALDPLNPGSLSTWINDSTVTGVLRDSLMASRTAERSEEWVLWNERRFTLAAAEVLLEALAGSTSGVDADDLLVDLDPHENACFYISEQSPGGTGQVEALALGLIEEPERLPMAIADAMRTSDIELMDQQLRSVIDSADLKVRASLAELSRSWAGGHEAVRRAADILDGALKDGGLVLEHPARIALSTRLAGPGADPDFILELREWLLVRDSAQARSGLAIEPRVLAGLLSGRAEVDSFLHLEAADEPRRTRAVANVLWPWGRGARSQRSYNPYSDDVAGSIELLRDHWHSPIDVITLTGWDDVTRDDVHARLRTNGELLLRVVVADRAVLRLALIDLHTTPVEVGPLWCYPEVLGVHDRGPVVEARLTLRESW